MTTNEPTNETLAELPPEVVDRVVGELPERGLKVVSCLRTAALLTQAVNDDRGRPGAARACSPPHCPPQLPSRDAQGAADPRLNQIMRRWANYFKHAVCKHTLDSLENFVWHRDTQLVDAAAPLEVERRSPPTHRPR